jgi:hypothetical protein
MKKKINKEKYDIYRRVFLTLCGKINKMLITFPTDEKTIKDCAVKLIVAGVQVIIGINYNDIEHNYKFASSAYRTIISAMLMLNPEELAKIFIPEKTYDGERYGEKDYFFAKRAIEQQRKIGFNNDIEALLNYLTDLNNLSAILFVINCNKIQRCQVEYENRQRTVKKIDTIMKKFKCGVILNKHGKLEHTYIYDNGRLKK